MAPDLDERVESVEVSKVVEIDGKNDMNLSCYKDPPTVGGDCNGIVHEGVKDDGDSSYVFVDGDETVSDDPVEKDPVTVADPSGELELGGEKNVTSSPTEEKQVEIDQSDVVSLLENDVAVDGPETNQGEVEKDDTVKEELDALVKGSEEPEVKSIEADESELGKPDTEITAAEKELKLEDETSGLVAEVDESKLPQENDGEEKVQEEALKNSAVNVEEGLNCSQTEAPEGIVKELENLDDVDQTSKVEVAEELETNQSLEETSEETSKPEVAEEVETIHNAEETAEETSKVEADEELETNQSSLPHQHDIVAETAEETSIIEVAEESETSQSSLSRQLDNVEETAEETSKPDGAEELVTNQSSFSHQLAEVEDKAEETSKPDAAEESEINQNSSTHQLYNGEVKAEETEELEAAEEAQINQKCPPDQLNNGQDKFEETRKPEATEESDISQNSSHQIDNGVEKTEEANNVEAVDQDAAIHSSPIGKVDNGVDKSEEANNVEAVEEAEVIKNSFTHEICNGDEKAEEADRIDAVEESEMIQSSPSLEIDNLGKAEEENNTEVNEETSKLEMAEESELNLNSPPHHPNEGEDKVERANDLVADEESEVNKRHTDNQLDNVEENATELSKAKVDEESEIVQSTTSHLLDNVEEKAGETNILVEAKELEIIQSTSREVPESGFQQLDNGEKVAETCKSTSSAGQEVYQVSQTVTESVDTELYHLDHTVTESVDTELHCLDHGKEQEAVRVANQIPIEDPAKHFETEQSVVEIVTCPSDVRQVDIEDMVDASESGESISTCPVEQTIPKTEVDHSVEHAGSISTCPISETESETECVKGSIGNYKSLAHAADEVRSKSEIEDVEVDRVGEGSIERVHNVTDVPVDEVEIKSEAPNGRSGWADEVVDDEQSDIPVERVHNVTDVPVDEVEIKSEAPNGRSSWADEVVDDEQSDIPVDDLEIESEAPDGCSNLADGAVDDAHLESEATASSVPNKGDLSDTNGLKDRSMPNSDNEVLDATNEGDKSAKCDNTSAPIAEEVAVHEAIESNGGLPASPKEAANDVLEVQRVDDEVIRRPFRFLIRIPRFVDDSIRDQIGLAQREVEEKTQSRDAIRLKLQSLRAISSEYRENFEAARSEERAARDVLTAKRREMDSIQLIISRIKNENSIDDIDDKVHNMEHRIQHETMPLKEEKQLIRDIKQLKNLREQVCSSLDRETEEITPEQRDRIDERYQSKKKEIDTARKEVQRAEGITKATRKIYLDESDKIKNLQDQFKVADGLRQKAYFQLQNLKKQLYEKNRYFRTYKEDAKRAEDFAFSADRDALQHLCVNQVEAVMELWNKNDEFRNEYIRCNKMSTLRRLRTLDGRSLGPDEEPPILYHAVDQRINSTTGSSANPITSISPVLTSEKGKSVVADVKPVVGVEEPNPKTNVTSVVKLEQKNPKAISKKETKPEVLENGSATVSGREQTVEKVDKNKKKEEEELRNKAEELARKLEEFRKAEAAAKLNEQLKEQKRLEEKAKAKEAEERKRRNAEKAQARADLRAQKEAELKEKEREKRARKKEKKKAAAAEASTGGAETESTSVETNLPETTREPEIKEKPKTVTKRPQKPSVLAKQTKTKVIPPPLRNRSKKRLQQWLWGGLVAVIVAVMLYAKLSILSNNAA